MMNKLLPCPFCGSDEPELVIDSNDYVFCWKCETKGPSGTSEYAIRKWNTRADHIPDATEKVNCPEKPDSWISVDDGLPDEGKMVVIWSPSFRSCEAEAAWAQYDYYQGGWRANHGYWYGKDTVTHWMPLPEPPEVKQ